MGKILYESKYGDVYYETYGSKEDLAVVFIHGVICNHETFRSQESELKKQYKVVLWDMPEHGNSFKSEKLNKVLLTFLEKLKF